jgi:RNA polymerase sigma-70 factor, ECF subfamily
MRRPQRIEPDGESSDAQLVEATRAGSTSALGELYERYARDLMALSYRLLQSPEDAEDVVHDVFVALPEALRSYEERGSLRAWLRTIAARVALARLRTTERRSVEPLDDTFRAAESDIHAVLSLEAAVRNLSPALRAVLVLKEIEGYSHSEVAELLDISIGASEVRLHRALLALRNALTTGEPT